MISLIYRLQKQTNRKTTNPTDTENRLVFARVVCGRNGQEGQKVKRKNKIKKQQKILKPRAIKTDVTESIRKKLLMRCFKREDES